MNRQIFDTYVETQLARTLQPGDVMILDNLPSHKSAKAEVILKQREAWFLFLPPYNKPIKKKFKNYPIGYFHIDIAEVQTAEGKLYLYVAIDRTSKFAFVQLVKKTGRTSASAFLTALIEAVPYKIHTVLTDNGIQFTFPQRYADGPTARYVTHMFDMCCQENGIEHRLTKVKHPWTNAQVERMNRTIKDATVNRYHYDSHQQLETHLADFIRAYNFGRRLKTLKGLTPYEFICKVSTNEPDRFRLDPIQQMPGLNT